MKRAQNAGINRSPGLPLADAGSIPATSTEGDDLGTANGSEVTLFFENMPRAGSGPLVPNELDLNQGAKGADSSIWINPPCPCRFLRQRRVALVFSGCKTPTVAVMSGTYVPSVESGTRSTPSLRVWATPTGITTTSAIGALPSWRSLVGDLMLPHQSSLYRV